MATRRTTATPNIANSVSSRGFIFPALLGHQLALHHDHAPAGFGRGCWTLVDGLSTATGLDLGQHRFRLVRERLAGRRAAAPGLI